MNRKDTYRRALLDYPSLFDCPLAVSCHLFAVVGNGYEWDENGELSAVLCDEEYLRHRRNERKIYEDVSCPELRNQFRLQDEAKQLKAKFIADNIEAVLDCSADTDFFKGSVRSGHYLFKGICWQHAKARAFTFPDNIQKDWAEALLAFLGWWMTNLRQQLGVSPHNDIDFWPDEFKQSYAAIKTAHDRLFPIVHGMTVEEQNKLIDDILNESEHADSDS